MAGERDGVLESRLVEEYFIFMERAGEAIVTSIMMRFAFMVASGVCLRLGGGDQCWE